MSLQEIVKNGKGTIVDVRTPEEFMGGSVPGAVNMPLHEIPSHMEEIKQLKTPLVLCCASGNRSGRARDFLLANGVSEALNGGSWLEVNAYRQN